MKLKIGLTAAALSAVGLLAPAGAAGTRAAAPEGAQAAATTSPVSLTGPKRVVAYSYDGQVYGDIGINLTAPEASFEVRSHRDSWKSPIRTVWHSPDGPVALPEGIQADWDGLTRFLRITATRASDGNTVLDRRRTVCLNSWSAQRTHPNAPLRNPYPEWCPTNAFTIGSVQGIQAGWVNNVSEALGGVALPPGKYDVTVRITKGWAKALGVTPEDATHSYRLVVRAEDFEGRRAPRQRRSGATPYGSPAAKAPAADEGGTTGRRPDLRSLPAFGMELSRNRKHLRFSATVWNAGDSPLVVDGFRRGNKDVMDAYQYFIDGDGNQTGYQRVGTMIWHKAKSHNHWHFEDFARYTLLKADRTEAVRSRKESFCLANTDAVDYTVPGADWRPDGTDLHTACGDRSTISLREVLASGSGDTYAQFRAGQAFRVDNLPNGVYYIAVEANPDRNLVESDTSNNVALRKVRLGGKGMNRSLKVAKVGVIEDLHDHGSHEH